MIPINTKVLGIRKVDLIVTAEMIVPSTEKVDLAVNSSATVSDTEKMIFKVSINTTMPNKKMAYPAMQIAKNRDKILLIIILSRKHILIKSFFR